MGSPPGFARIGVVGLGEMGRPMVGRLVAAGHEVMAFVRRADARAGDFQGEVAWADSLPQLGAECDLVIVFVYTDEQVREVALGSGLIEAMKPDSILAVHTTSNPQTMALLADHAAPREIGVVDAPVSGTAQSIVDGRITLFVGGATDNVARCSHAFSSYADPVLHIGPLGSGQSVKLVNNVALGAHLQVAVEAARLGEEFGLDTRTVATAVTNGSGRSVPFDLLASYGSTEAMLTAVGRFVRKDVIVAQSFCDALGTDLGCLDSVLKPLLAGRP